MRSARFLPDGRRLAVGYFSNNVKIWDLPSRQVERRRSAIGKITSLDVTSNGRLIAALTEQGEVRLWDARSGTLLQAMTASKIESQRLTFSPDGRLLAFPSSEIDVEVWQRAECEPIRFSRKYALSHSAQVCGVAISADSRLLAYGGKDNHVTVWDLETGQIRLVIPAHSDTVLDVSFSPTGRYVVSGSLDCTAKVWDAQTGKQVHLLVGHTERVHSVAFSPDGRLIATGSFDGSARLWDSKSGAQLARCQVHSATVREVTFAKDGSTLATCGSDGLLKLWDVEGLLSSVDRPIRCARQGLAISPRDGALGFPTQSSDEAEIVVLDPRTHAVTGRCRRYDPTILISLAFSPSGAWLASGGGTWRAGLARPLDASGPLSAEDKAELTLWDARSGELRAELDGGTAMVTAVCFSPVTDLLASGSADGTVRLWDTRTTDMINVLARDRVPVASLDFSPDGRYLAIGTMNNEVEVWQRAGHNWSLRTRLMGHDDWVRSVKFFPDGERLVSTGLDSTIRIWETRTWQQVRSVKAHDAWTLSVAVSPDGRTIATAGADTKVVLWNVATLRPLLTLKGHTSQVWDVVFSPHGDLLASSAPGETVRVWRADEGRSASHHR